MKYCDTCGSTVEDMHFEGCSDCCATTTGPVPLWSECSRKVDIGERLTALEMFVYNNEPAYPHGLSFREELLAVLKEQNSVI